MQCRGAIYHLVDPRIAKNRQNPQVLKIQAAKFQGVFFLRVPNCGRQLPLVTHFGGTLKPVNMSMLSQHSRHFSKRSTLQNLKIESLECVWERFPHIHKSRSRNLPPNLGRSIFHQTTDNPDLMGHSLVWMQTMASVTFTRRSPP